MSNELSLILSISQIIGLIIFLIIVVLQNHTISTLVEALKAANSNPALITSIKGATEGVPQSIFDKVLAILAAAQIVAPTQDLKNIAAEAEKFVEEVDHNPANDPHPVDPTVPEAAKTG